MKKGSSNAQDLESQKDSLKVGRLSDAGPISRLFWLWCNDLIELANQTPLTHDFLDTLPESSRSDNLVRRFDVHWKKQMKENPKPSLFWALFMTFYREAFTTGFMNALANLFQLCSPLLIQALLSWLQKDDGSIGEGVVLAICLFGICFIGQVIISPQSFMTLYRVGMDCRTVLNARIYEKALLVSNADRNKVSTGEVVNLMSADSEKLVFMCLLGHSIWLTPIFVGFAIYLLVSVVGIAILPSLAVLFLSAPIQGIVIKKQQALQKAVMKTSDARVKLVNEVLQGIRVCKYYNWEGAFEKRLMEARAIEVKLLKRLAQVQALNNTLMNATPMLMLVTLILCVYLSNDDFSPETIFVAVALLQMIRFPLIMIPMAIGMVVMGMISLKRISAYLMLEEQSDDTASLLEIAPNAVGTITVARMVFAWPPAPEKKEKKPRKKRGKKNDKKNAKYDAVETKDGNAEDTGDDAVTDGVALTQISVADDTENNKTAAGGLENGEIFLEDFTVAPGTLLAVTGRVGSGKTSLLLALLGEMDTQSKSKASANGKAWTNLFFCTPPTIHGRIGYAAQQPWITNATLRENVLFGMPYEKKKYDRIMECCALKPDLKILPAGDQTEIGEKGINLSGGQKARVGIARAVYAEPDVLLLDDVLAAVDAHVGLHIFKECILKELRGRGKTVVLVTNKLSLLPEVDDVIVMQGGKMVDHGTCEVLQEKGGTFAELMHEFVGEEDEAASNPPELEGGGVEGGGGDIPRQVSRQVSRQRSVSIDGNKDGKGGTLVEDEEKAVGSVGLPVYKSYFVDVVGGYGSFFMIVVFTLTATTSQLVFDWWLSQWTDAWEEAEEDDGISDSDSHAYLGIYIGLGLTVVLLTAGRYLNLARHTALASEGLFGLLLKGVLRTTIEFFDTTPVGRILNRFAKDSDLIDTQLPQKIMSFDGCLFNVIGVLTMTAVILPWSLVVLLPVMFLYLRTMKRFVPASRDLQRLESMSRSPIFATFSETLTGVASIRAFGRSSELIEANKVQLDNANRPFFFMHHANRWLQQNLEGLGAIIILSVTMLIVLSRDKETASGVLPSITVGSAGLLLSYTLQITGLMNWTVRCACDMESAMTCVQRNDEYANLVPEPGTFREDGGETKPTDSKFLTKGKIVFEKVDMRYRQGLPLVLKKVDFTIEGGKKVGVCGRSGSGKSSLLVALYRMTPLAHGGISLDGVEATSLTLSALRGALGIIPQDPVLFVGTLRDNLDAFKQFTEEDLWEALRCASLDKAVRDNVKNWKNASDVNPLDAPVEEGGANWSMGQRQLICLARAVLRKPKILAVDEATANIDLETDALVQKSIRTKFKDSTTITIAHRLETILDSDLIITMDDGKVAEFDSPENLLNKPGSIFAELVRKDKSVAAISAIRRIDSGGSLQNNDQGSDADESGESLQNKDPSSDSNDNNNAPPVEIHSSDSDSGPCKSGEGLQNITAPHEEPLPTSPISSAGSAE